MTPTEPGPVLSLDCRGLRCPRPIIEIARRIGEVEVGQLVELLADDPAAGPDLAAWCRLRGQELVASIPPRFLVRRLAAPTPDPTPDPHDDRDHR